jgi:carboxylesterase
MNTIIPTAEPFLLVGEANKPACLLVHGFTGTPKEMLWMGEFLHGQGYTCLGIRLAGHATHPEDMILSTRADWIASVEDGYHTLCGLTDKIFMIGLSMGGVLSLLLAAHLDVMGVVAMSTPYRMPSDYPVWLMRLFSYFMPFHRKGSGEPGSGWFDSSAYREHISYPRNPVRSAAELKLLILEMRKSLPEVHVPVLLMHSRDDRYVLPDNMEQIYNKLTGASDKSRLFISGSGHVLPRDAARQDVFQRTLEFIQRVGSSRNIA